MKIWRLLLVIIGALLLIGAVVFWVGHLYYAELSKVMIPAGDAPMPQAKGETEVAESPVEPRAPAAPLHPLALTFGDAGTAPEEEPAVLLEILEGYRRLRGAFPTAEDNAALMRILTGRQPGALAVFPEEHPRLNAAGELVDAWGTPFFFHHLSSQALEIRSAGPDREFYTDADLIVPLPREGR